MRIVIEEPCEHDWPFAHNTCDQSPCPHVQERADHRCEGPMRRILPEGSLVISKENIDYEAAARVKFLVDGNDHLDFDALHDVMLDEDGLDFKADAIAEVKAIVDAAILPALAEGVAAGADE